MNEWTNDERRATSQNEIVQLCTCALITVVPPRLVLVFTCYCRFSVINTDQNSEKLSKRIKKRVFSLGSREKFFPLLSVLQIFWDTSTNQNRGSRSVKVRIVRREPTKKPKVPQKAALDKKARHRVIADQNKRIPLQWQSPHPQEVNF